jgi:3',5'-cyclic AMP phosphodiesterase CpdA
VSGDSPTRRELLARGLAGGVALALAGCARQRRGQDGSTLQRTWKEVDGELALGGGEPLLERTELAPAARFSELLGTLAHVPDAHVLDAQSPARVTFLDRLGPPFTSTFRPQEALTTQVLDGAIRAVGLLAPDAVIQGGDLIDNAQHNELTWGLALLTGGRVDPGSGSAGYFGVQSAADPDPFYYRPDVDAPRHPGMLEDATRPFLGRGLRVPCYPVLGDHDLLVQGVVAPTPLTGAIALGDRAVWDLPEGLTLPASAKRLAAAAPDGLPAPGPLRQLIEQLLSAPTVRVPADPRRRELQSDEVVARLRTAARVSGNGELLDYSFDVGEQLRVVVLDLVRRGGGSDGQVHKAQPQWLARQLSRAGRRWILVVSHQPLASSAGGEQLLALLDRHPRTLAALSGHTHRNRVVPRPGRGGGYWLVSTASLIDFPQQARALRVYATLNGGAALQTWMLDHVPSRLGDISRELAFLDAQGGRPQRFAGGKLDQNVTLYRA